MRRREVNLVHLKVEAAAPLAATLVERQRWNPVPDGFFRVVELDATTMTALAADHDDHSHVYLLRVRTARESGRVPWGGSDTLRVRPSSIGPRPKLVHRRLVFRASLVLSGQSLGGRSKAFQ